MKKSLKIFCTVAISTFILSACDIENDLHVIGDSNPGDNEFSFALKNVGTRSAVNSNDQVTPGKTISLGTDDNGNELYLQESVIDLNAPVTRGIPAYTENVVKLYGGQMAVKSQLSEREGNEEGIDIYTYNQATTYFSKSYGKDIWTNWGVNVGTEANPDWRLDFYMYMPTDMLATETKKGVSNLEYNRANDGTQTIAFDYESPATASEQQDILFSARSVLESQYNENNKKVSDVLFHHALTGVKFSTANYISGNVEGTKTYITKITFKGLKNSGHCVVTPVKENGEYKDYKDGDEIYSSSQEGVVVWSDPVSNGEGEESGDEEETESIIYQTFTPDNYAENIYSESTDYNNFPASFYQEDATFHEPGHKTTDWNINDKNASLTFWLIPQTLSGVELEIEFYIQAGEEEAGGKRSETFTRSIVFNEGVEWKAGQLRTYVLKATEVAVTVEDKMNPSGTEKTMIQIRNMGNVPEWVRATVVGYWADEDGNAIFGYSSNEVDDDGKYISDAFFNPWDLETERSSSPVYGSFTSWDTENWVKGSDGYYYYNNIIGVDQAATTNLFSKYTVSTTPSIYPLDRNTLKRASTAVPVHLEMKIVVQAILAKATQTKDKDGHYVYTATEDYTDAWADAKIIATTTEP